MMTQYEHFNVSEYLDRIDCPLEVTPTARYLKLLHRAHLQHIPFENLDNFVGNQVLLDIDRLFKKIVLGARGGFCYELNGLFFELLQNLGFKTKLISARVYNKEGAIGPEFDHMAILVDFQDQQFLADVGFGISFLQPLKFETDQVQMDQNRFYRIIKDLDDIYYLQSSKDSIEFKNEYQFTTKNRSLVEFIKMCQFHNRDQKSHLTRSRFVNQFNKVGRITIWQNMMHIWEKGQLREIPITNIDDFDAKVAQHIGINLSTS